MANKKREATSAQSGPPAKKAKLATTKPVAPPPPAVAAKSAAPKTTAKRPAPPSTLLETTIEVDFPRGAAPRAPPSASGPRSKPRDGDNLFADKATQDADDFDRERAKRRKLEKAKTKKRLEEANAPKPPSDTLRVEHLNYKRLIPGTRLLTQIIAITELELILSLPNQLLGHVPVISVSRYLTERLEGLAGKDSSDESDDDEDNAADDVPSLSRLFTVGQTLTAVVVATQTSLEARVAMSGSRRGDDNYRSSRRVELSVDPAKVNEDVTRPDLTVGYPITAAVKSVEDNGYVLDLGVADGTSFVSFDAAKKALGGRSLTIGQLVSAKIAKIASNGRMCTLQLDDKALKTSLVRAHRKITYSAQAQTPQVETPPTIAAVLPGMLVQALVTAVVPSGLNVKFLGFFDGTIDLFHLGRAGDVTKSYKPGEKIRARVLASLPIQSPKTFSLTTLPHLLSLSPPATHTLTIGAFVDNVVVARVEREWGLSMKLPGQPIANAFVHISRVSDDRIDQLSANAGPWQLGTAHRARVISYSDVDGLIQLSLQPSVLAQTFMRVSDVQVGEAVRGTVKRMGENALFVSISGSVDAVVWPMHYSDLKLKHPERKFKEGAIVKARIFAADAERNRITLTLKKSLLTSDLPVFTSIEQAETGAVVDGIVGKIMDKAILLDLFGGLRALVPIGEVADEYIEDLSRAVTLGQTVKARITKVDPAASRIDASIRKALSTAPPPVDVSGIEVGAATRGVVETIHPENLVLRLETWNAIGLLSISTLSRYRNMPEDEVRATHPVGTALADLRVVSKNEARSFVIVGFPRPTNAQIGISRDILDIETLDVGGALPVRVVSRDQHGLLVQISRNLRGRVHWTDVADDFDQAATVAPSASPSQKVPAVIVGLDREASKIDLALRESLVEDDDGREIRDPVFVEVGDVRSGMRIRGFVKNISDSGLFVAIGRGLTARVLIKELFDDYVEDWKGRFQVGQVVEGTVTSVVEGKKQIEMRLRSGDTAKRGPDEISFADLQQGAVVTCVIKKIAAYGCFLRIDGSSISGLCHKSEVTDSKGPNWADGLTEGARVRALVLEVTPATRKISFSLKPSRLPEEEEEVEAEEATLTTLLRDGSEAEEDSDVEIDLGLDEGDESEDDIAVAAAILPPKPVKVAPLKISSAFDWNASNGTTSTQAVDDGEEDGSSSEDEAPAIPKPARRSGATADAASPTEFEHLLVAQPNSSRLWIKYMDFHLDSADVPKAREVAERALETIHYREEEEKLNVWIAVLNLENNYGTPTTRDAAFADAVQHNDPLTAYLKMAEVFETSRKYGEVEELYERALKKFSQAPELWTRVAQYYFSRDKATEARDLLPRSLKSLPKPKHVDTISKFAQMEFKVGEAERGRTIFEGILDSYPKRLDLWSVYIDMESRAKNIAAVRSLFDRLLQRKQSSKKVKFALKKWLAFEKAHGDEAGVETVKQRAVDYVASQTAQAADDEDVEMEADE